MLRPLLGVAGCLLALLGSVGAQVQWTRNGAPNEATLTGGGWTLERSGAAVGLKSAGYCDANGNQIGNLGTERMQPYPLPMRRSARSIDSARLAPHFAQDEVLVGVEGDAPSTSSGKLSR